MKIKMAASMMAVALTVSLTPACWADAPVLKDSPTGVSQLSQAQAIMGSDANPDAKLEQLYNGSGSAKQLGAPAPVAAPADAGGMRHLEIGAAPAAGLDHAFVPGPMSSAAPSQARVGFWDSGAQGINTTALVASAVLLIVVGVVIASNNQPPQTPYQRGYNVGQATAQSDAVNAGYQSGYAAGVALDPTSAYHAGYSAAYPGH